MNSANDVNRGRWMVLAFASVVLLTGFILGRLSASSDPVATAETKPATAAPVAAVPATSPMMPGYATTAAPAAATVPTYPGGLAQTPNGFDPAMPVDFRSGYSEGFKQGFAEANATKAPAPVTRASNTVVTRRVYYKPAPQRVYYEQPRKKNSTLKTVLTIAAPAAIGAGVGAAVAGGKGAGAGALIGGGGGALYHLIRNR